jgi:hypothetical protein
MWKGVHYDVLRSDVLILRIGCRGLALGWNSHGGDSEFLDPAFERDRAAGHPLDDAANNPRILTDQMSHEDSQARGGA